MNQTSPPLTYPAVNALKALHTRKTFLDFHIGVYQLPQDFTLSGLKKDHLSVTVITGSGFDVEAGIPTFREKGFYEDNETAYLSSVDAFNSEPIRQWRWYLKRFVSYHSTPPAASHIALAELEAE